MIIGPKVVKGVKVRIGSARGKEGVAKLMVDGTGARIPVQFGPQAEMKVESEERMEWNERGYVLAYRLRKIACEKGKLVEGVTFNKGGFLDAGKMAREEEDAELHYLIDDEDTGAEMG